MADEKKRPDTRRKRNPRRRNDRNNNNNNNRKQGFEKEFDKEAWKPKSEIGKLVKSGKIKDIDEILDLGNNILEAEIIDVLLPGVTTELLLVGQSKGKFGGGARRIFRQTQKKTREGNKPRFSTVAAVGNENGYIGIGYGKSKETVPAREKSMRNAKINMFKIQRACGSWACGCKEPHTIPFEVQGKCGSVIIKLMPAPKGTGLKIEKECGKILKLAGIKDVWSKTLGHTSTKLNLIYACNAALKQLMIVKTKEADIENLGILEGAMKKAKTEEDVPEQVEDMNKKDIPNKVEDMNKKTEEKKAKK